MSCSYHQPDGPEGAMSLHRYSSDFVTKAMARLVRPIDPKNPEQYPADLTVLCGSLKVEAHSHVLCQESSYFKVICKGGFLEEYTRELVLPAEEEFLIRRLLCYCYTTGYNDEAYDDENDPPPHFKAPAYVNRLHLNSQMYSVADKYDIASLKDKAARKFDTVRETTTASLVDDIMEAIPHIYSSTLDRDRGLRERAFKIVHCNYREFERHPGLGDLTAKAPEFFNDLHTKYYHQKLSYRITFDH